MLRSLLERHDELAKENEALRDQVKLLKADKSDHSEALKLKMDSLRDELALKDDELAVAKRDLARAAEKNDGLSAQLADAISEKHLAEEQLRLRIRLLLQQFGQHVEQSISQRPPQSAAQQPPPLAPSEPSAPQPTLPVEAEPSVPERAPQLPCDVVATDEYTSSTSSSESGSDCEEARPGPPPSEL